jgi:GNAT superfamily N-acetyltransferase
MPFVRLADQPDTADLGVTVVDAWQGRGLGSVLLARLSERALEVGIEYFTAEVLAENRAMLSLLPALGRVESESLGPVVTARIEIAEPPGRPGRISWTCWQRRPAATSWASPSCSVG